jgi:hypothetical protein
MRRTNEHRRMIRPLLLPALLAVALTSPAAAGATSHPGTYRGSVSDAQGGSIALRFEREPRVGLQLVHVRLAGTVDCDGQTIDLGDQSGPLTARARVDRKGRFAHRGALLQLRGRITSARAASGTLVVRSLSCESPPLRFTARLPR